MNPLDLWLLAAVATAAPAAAASRPSAELLEFVAEWSPAEQHLIDQQAPAVKPARRVAKEDDHGHETQDDRRTR